MGQCILAISGYKIPVKIGWSQEERQVPQAVQFDVRLRFKKIPTGCHTDQLKDTVCYFQLSERIKELCQLQEFHLVEKLAFETFQLLKRNLSDTAELQLTVTKLHPPMENLSNGASFT